MTGAVLSALASHWRRNRLQLLTLVLGLALATALWSGVQAINAEARASYDAAAATLAEGRFDQLMPREGDSVAQEVFVALRRAGWLVSPVAEGRLRVGGTAPLHDERDDVHSTGATTQTRWPLVTEAPTLTATSRTTPTRGATISFSIFIASTTHSS